MASETTIDNWKVVFSCEKLSRTTWSDFKTYFRNRFHCLDFLRFSEFLCLFFDFAGLQDLCVREIGQKSVTWPPLQSLTILKFVHWSFFNLLIHPNFRKDLPASKELASWGVAM